jgi:flagellar biosynthesis/type III secretory pathway M-ring protein FliF/YscJ
MGSMNRAAVVLALVAGEVARVLRSVRPMRNQATKDTDQPALQRDPDEWKTGDEPMTDAQRSYLETLCRETGEEFDDTLSKADASKRIEELRERSPRLAHE